MKTFIVIGHLSDREQGRLIAMSASADGAVTQFATQAYGTLDPEDLVADYDELEEAKLNGDLDEAKKQTSEAVSHAVAYWRNGEAEAHDLPELYIDHVFESSGQITALDASDFPGGIST